MAHAMPGWVQAMWSVLAVVAGGLGLVGVLWPGQAKSLRRLSIALGIEMFGVFVLASVCSMDALALLWAIGLAGVPSGLFTSAIALGAWGRVWRIRTDRRRLESAGADCSLISMQVLVDEESRQ
jgi:hypothetical protein